jgi:hypothetical protein
MIIRSEKHVNLFDLFQRHCEYLPFRLSDIADRANSEVRLVEGAFDGIVDICELYEDDGRLKLEFKLYTDDKSTFFTFRYETESEIREKLPPLVVKWLDKVNETVFVW